MCNFVSTCWLIVERMHVHVEAMRVSAASRRARCARRSQVVRDFANCGRVRSALALAAGKAAPQAQLALATAPLAPMAE
jgi:hypothetical protein